MRIWLKPVDLNILIKAPMKTLLCVLKQSEMNADVFLGAKKSSQDQKFRIY